MASHVNEQDRQNRRLEQLVATLEPLFGTQRDLSHRKFGYAAATDLLETVVQ